MKLIVVQIKARPVKNKKKVNVVKSAILDFLYLGTEGFQCTAKYLLMRSSFWVLSSVGFGDYYGPE